ncbi:MAG: hypothetical protein E7677_02065 [Ruminococcaceae bacterium]|nr:hypothetical protein [Oscillospiraceae bacterium]
MKKRISRILAVLLTICMLPLPFAALPASAAVAVDYDDADDGDLLYTVDFSGDSVFKSPGSSWAGATVDTTQTSVTMYTKSDSKRISRGSAWGADLKGYTVLGKAYTTVFTLTASDSDEEIGFLPCDWAGFVIAPGQNKYKFVTTKHSTNDQGRYEGEITSGTYNGTGALTQTYAVEFKVSGTEANPSVDAYNLYVKSDDTWMLVCALTDEQMDESYFDWFYYYSGVYEEDFTMRFYRRYYKLDSSGFTTSTQDLTQQGIVTVSDAKVYKGLISDLNQPQNSKIYYQLTKDNSNLRIIGVVDFTEEELKNYANLGFNVTMSFDGKDYKRTFTTQNVYTSLVADGKTIYASEYGNYFFAIDIADLEFAAAEDVVFEVEGFATKLDETVENVLGSRKIRIDGDPLSILPTFEGYSFDNTNTGDDCYMRSFGEVYYSDFEDYCDEIAESGFELYAEKTLEDNVYKTYVNKRYVVTTIYTAYNSYGKVLVEPRVGTALPTKAEDNVYNPIAGVDTTITQVGLYYGSLADTYNGMSYVVQLNDGSFIVVDGGFAYEGYADRLYSVLKKQAPDPDNIVIAAWIISHAHDDHVDVFESFFESYGDKVTVERFICNLPEAGQLVNNWSDERDGNISYTNKIREFLYTTLKDIPKVKAHPGQEFNIRNVKIDILYTIDIYDYDNKKLDDFNNTSVVFKLTAEGKSMLFLGDYDDKAYTMKNLYTASTLNSDIVQVAHHGLPENSSGALYQLITPEYVFWPAAAWVVKNGTVNLKNGSQNEWIIEKCDEENIYLAENNVYVFNMKDLTCDKYDTVAEYLVPAT